VLAKLEEANQIGRHLGPDGFYNQLISEKMDVQDHYTAWRQTQVGVGCAAEGAGAGTWEGEGRTLGRRRGYR
jgi:hypothetical protein